MERLEVKQLDRGGMIDKGRGHVGDVVGVVKALLHRVTYTTRILHIPCGGRFVCGRRGGGTSGAAGYLDAVRVGHRIAIDVVARRQTSGRCVAGSNGANWCAVKRRDGWVSAGRSTCNTGRLLGHGVEIRIQNGRVHDTTEGEQACQKHAPPLLLRLSSRTHSYTRRGLRPLVPRLARPRRRVWLRPRTWMRWTGASWRV